MNTCKFCGNKIGNGKDGICVFCISVYQFIINNPKTIKKMIKEIDDKSRARS
jgi:ribosomal protein L24E